MLIVMSAMIKGPGLQPHKNKDHDGLKCEESTVCYSYLPMWYISAWIVYIVERYSSIAIHSLLTLDPPLISFSLNSVLDLPSHELLVWYDQRALCHDTTEPHLPIPLPTLCSCDLWSFTCPHITCNALGWMHSHIILAPPLYRELSALIQHSFS